MVFREGCTWDVVLLSVVVLISKQIPVMLKDGKSWYFWIPNLKSNLKIKQRQSHCDYWKRTPKKRIKLANKCKKTIRVEITVIITCFTV